MLLSRPGCRSSGTRCTAPSGKAHWALGAHTQTPNQAGRGFSEPVFPAAFYSTQKPLCVPLRLDLFSFFKKDFIIIFLEKGEGNEKERERNIDVGLPCTPPAGDLARNPGLCPDRESNWWLFGLQAGAQSTESQQPGLNSELSLLSAFLHRAKACTRALLHSIQP